MREFNRLQNCYYHWIRSTQERFFLKCFDTLLSGVLLMLSLYRHSRRIPSSENLWSYCFSENHSWPVFFVTEMTFLSIRKQQALIKHIIKVLGDNSHKKIGQNWTAFPLNTDKISYSFDNWPCPWLNGILVHDKLRPNIT